MSKIALYNLLKKIPNATDEEAKEAVADLVSLKEAAPKLDIKDMVTKTDLMELENRLTWKMVAISLAMIGIIKYL